MRYLLTMFFLTRLISSPVFAQDSVRVFFIYGSRPAKAYRNSEPKWFGGIRGGHVGLQIGPDSVLNFRSTVYHPCHFFPRTHLRNFRDTFEIRTLRQSWEIFPPHHYNIDSLQRAIVVIPVTTAQREALGAIIRRYDRQKPYDYATLGMRCASATYDVLQEAGLVPFHRHRNWLRYFAPRAFRHEIFTLARKRQWKTYMYKGGASRIWERDRVGDRDQPPR